jgi:DNA-binding NarL/FixJ family response regulator
LHHRALGRDLDQLAVSVVDNRRPMLSVMRAMLAAIGVGRIETYESPAEALDAMARSVPDLVVAAAAMKPVTGPELISTMRHVDNGPLCFVPAMVTSAHAKPGVVAEALRSGAHQVLVLPTSASTLYRRLDWLLNDDRPFECRGDQYVVAGLEERLALSTLRPAYEPAPARAPFAVGETTKATGTSPYALKARAARN